MLERDKEDRENFIKDLVTNLTKIGGQDANFLPRTHNMRSIGDDQSLTESLNQLAAKSPCPPYSVVALKENKLFVTLNEVKLQGNYEGINTFHFENVDQATEEVRFRIKQDPSKTPEELEKTIQFQEEINKGIIKKQLETSTAYTDISNHLNQDPSIEFISYSHGETGEHPDTITLFRAINSGNPNNKVTLGLARFQTNNNTGEIALLDKPASCAVCGAAIEALNNLEHDINVKSVTPTSFPRDAKHNYKISDQITANTRLLTEFLTQTDEYLKGLRDTLATQDREELSELYARYHATGDNPKNKTVYQEYYDFYKEEYLKNDTRPKDTEIEYRLNSFTEGREGLNQFIDLVDETRIMVRNLKILNQNIAKQEEAVKSVAKELGHKKIRLAEAELEGKLYDSFEESPPRREITRAAEIIQGEEKELYNPFEESYSKLTESTLPPRKRARSDTEHLKRTEREELSQEKGENYNLKEAINALNIDNPAIDRALSKIEVASVVESSVNVKALHALPDRNISDNSKEAQKTDAVDPPKPNLTIVAESDHSKQHGNNAREFERQIKDGAIDKDTVILLERKAYGDNLGMQDVIKLANILQHNEQHQQDSAMQIKIPAEIEKNPMILADAGLYKTAREHGVRVIGMEGNNLSAQKDNIQDYNTNREQYMAGVIHEVQSKGYNVIVNTGSAHVEKEQGLAGIKELVERLKDEPSRGMNNIPRKLASESEKTSQASSQAPNIKIPAEQEKEQSQNSQTSKQQEAVQINQQKTLTSQQFVRKNPGAAEALQIRENLAQKGFLVKHSKEKNNPSTYIRNANTQNEKHSKGRS